MPRLVASSSSVVPFPNIDVVDPRAPAKHPCREKMMCLSPDGLSVNSLTLTGDSAYIETHRLPLPGSTEEQDPLVDDNKVPALVRTLLPDRAQTALKMSPPIELLCVDVESAPSNTDDCDATTSCNKGIPRLCVYTEQDAFVLEITYTPTGQSTVEGIVTSLREPFDYALLGTAASPRIVRIRPAPQRRMGYATMCPSECMAMLTFDASTNEYRLDLHQANGSISTPLVYGMELDEAYERITDFCFCQSVAFPVLSSLTILLLKGSGEVLMASPIVFRDTVLPKQQLSHALDFLETEISRLNSSSAKWRQYRTARQFLLDAFPEEGRSDYTMAQVRSDAFEWPVQIQGPVLVTAEDGYDSLTLAAIIEPVPAGDLVGVALGRQGYSVDFGLLSPTLLIPRFKFEGEDDKAQLDGDLKWGPIVQRVDLSREGENGYLPMTALIPDPIMDTVLHCVSPTEIRSISTNVMKIVANQIREQSRGIHPPPPFSTGKGKDRSQKTTAWSCLDISDSSVSVRGAVVASRDSNFGHVLISRLSDGSMVATNLTETRHFHEMELLADSQEGGTPSKNEIAANRALRALEESEELREILEPLFHKVASGLADMGKIVGSNTATKDITPDFLAVALSVKERCDNQICLPLIEMSEVIRAQRKQLKALLENQEAQLSSLKESIATLKEHMAAIKEKTEVARKNAASLAHRSSSVLQSSKDLLPSLTQAENGYFQELKQLESRTRAWVEDFNQLDTRVAGVWEAIDGSDISGPQVALSEETIGKFRVVLEGGEKKMEQQKGKLTRAREQLEEAQFEVGLDLEPKQLGAIDQ